MLETRIKIDIVIRRKSFTMWWALDEVVRVLRAHAKYLVRCRKRDISPPISGTQKVGESTIIWKKITTKEK